MILFLCHLKQLSLYGALRAMCEGRWGKWLVRGDSDSFSRGLTALWHITQPLKSWNSVTTVGITAIMTYISQSSTFPLSCE